MRNERFSGIFGKNLTDEEIEEINTLIFSLQRNIWSTISIVSQLLFGVKPTRQ